MSYALGAVSNISVGRLARRDPIVAFSSVMASSLLRQAVRSARKGDRLSWLRSEVNKAQVGLGDEVVSKVKQLVREGVPGNQALFDGVRLTLANHVADRMDALAPKPGLGALGSTASDVFCGILGVGTAGGAIAASFDNPTGSVAIGTAGASAMEAAGCNSAALTAQARIAEANAAAAQAAASMSADKSGESNTMMYVALGGGALLLLGIGVVILKK